MQIIEFLKTDYSHDMDTDPTYMRNKYLIILLLIIVPLKEEFLLIPYDLTFSQRGVITNNIN